MHIDVTFDADSGGRLTIRDTGDAVPKAVATRLFSVPVPSRNGLGIGLYQAAKQAEQAGYTLQLVSNVAGNVCFELRRTVN